MKEFKDPTETFGVNRIHDLANRDSNVMPYQQPAFVSMYLNF